MDITLIRHTSVAIDKGICYGQTDVLPSSNFALEMLEIASKIKDIKFDVIYSSPLQRCRMLAKALFPNKTIIVDNRLIELNFGKWEGLKWDDIFNTPEGKAFFDSYFEMSCPGGESYKDLIKRISAFYNEIKSIHSMNRIAIITHSGPIRAFLQLLKGISPQSAFEWDIKFGDTINLNEPN